MAKRRGWHNFANSFIINSNNQIIYLNTKYEDIIEMLRDNHVEIYVEISPFYGRGGFAIAKADIENIGRVPQP